LVFAVSPSNTHHGARSKTDQLGVGKMCQNID